MAKIAVIVADLFEDSEYTEPVAAFRAAGHEVVNVGLEGGKTIKGKKLAIQALREAKDEIVSVGFPELEPRQEKDLAPPVVISQSVDSASADEFDALLIPGGYSPDKLRADQKAVRFVKKFMDAAKPVFSICHGPQLLITAKVLEGRKITGWKSIVQDLLYAGAHFQDKEVVVDENLISSRSPADLPAFIAACLEKLEEPKNI